MAQAGPARNPFVMCSRGNAERLRARAGEPRFDRRSRSTEAASAGARALQFTTQLNSSPESLGFSVKKGSPRGLMGNCFNAGGEQNERLSFGYTLTEEEQKCIVGFQVQSSAGVRLRAALKQGRDGIGSKAAHNHSQQRQGA